MSFDLQSVAPRANPWFSECSEYRGVGTAKVQSPDGTMEGPTTVKIGPFGMPTIVMRIERVQTEAKLDFGPVQLLYRDQPKRDAGPVTWDVGGRLNNCTDLRISCQEGTFMAGGKIMTTGHKLSLPSDEVEVRFVPLRARLEAPSCKVSKYWVLPLANFLSECYQHHPQLDRHPLRIFSTPEISQGLLEPELSAATFKASERNRLIIFEFNNSLGFIELLPDYQDRKSRLESGKDKCLITALMVGEVPSESTQWTDLETWFPFRLFDILSLATGSEVGAPWVEFRDDEGRLVRRFHASMGARSYLRGHRVINEVIHRGTGHLMTCALKSPDFRKGSLHVTIKHVVRSGVHEGAFLEDRFNQVARGLDSVAKHLKLDHVDLLEDVSPDRSATVSAALGTASNAIRWAAHQARNQSKQDEGALLERIASRVESGTTTAWDFGQAVTRVLDHYELHDAPIIEGFYARLNPKGGHSWTKRLSKYRATVMHGGFYDSDDVREVYSLLNHLHDVLVRLILMTLEYEGTYQPTVAKWTIDARKEWVTPKTPPADLGFEDIASAEEG